MENQSRVLQIEIVLSPSILIQSICYWSIITGSRYCTAAITNWMGIGLGWLLNSSCSGVLWWRYESKSNRLLAKSNMWTLCLIGSIRWVHVIKFHAIKMISSARFKDCARFFPSSRYSLEIDPCRTFLDWWALKWNQSKYIPVEQKMSVEIHR